MRISGPVCFDSCSFALLISELSLDLGWAWIRRLSLTSCCLRGSLSDTLCLWIRQISWMKWHFLTFLDWASKLNAWILSSWHPVTLWHWLQHQEAMRDLSCFRSDLWGSQDITTSQTRVAIYYKKFFLLLPLPTLLLSHLLSSLLFFLLIISLRSLQGINRGFHVGLGLGNYCF